MPIMIYRSGPRIRPTPDHCTLEASVPRDETLNQARRFVTLSPSPATPVPPPLFVSLLAFPLSCPPLFFFPPAPLRCPLSPPRLAVPLRPPLAIRSRSLWETSHALQKAAFAGDRPTGSRPIPVKIDS